MHYVYLLKSLKTGSLYIGVTSDLKRRLQEHNRCSDCFTKSGQPWQLVYYEAYKDKADAYKRERRLKNYGSSLAHLKKRLVFSLR